MFCGIKFLEKLYLDRRLYKLSKQEVQEWYELSSVYKNKKNIENLILGSSHGGYGLKAEHIFNSKHSMNLCTDSQDLYRSYELAKQCMEKFKIKNIILTYSLFSNSFMLDMVKGKRVNIYLSEILFNIKARVKKTSYDKKYKKLYELYIKHYLLGKEYKYIYRNIFGDIIDNKTVFTDDYGVEKRVKSHIKHNKRNNNENVWIKKLYKLFDDSLYGGGDLHIVIMPVRSDYRQEALKYGNTKQLFNNIIEICKENNIKLHNYFQLDINNKYFCDFDHLNNKGAELISKKLKEDIGIEGKTND